jgi:predicted hydrolase (HD superfamily)
MSEFENAPAAGAASELLDRDRVVSLLHEYTEGAGLRKHAYAVEAAMRAYAHRSGGDDALWGAAGLLHDMDYEQHPSKEEHPFVGCGWRNRIPARPQEAILVTRHLAPGARPWQDPTPWTSFAAQTATALVMPSR